MQSFLCLLLTFLSLNALGALGGGKDKPKDGSDGKLVDLFSYTVYASNSIEAQCSDFLGNVGIGRKGVFRDFLIRGQDSSRCAIESGRELFMTRGSLENEAGLSCAATPKLRTVGNQNRGRKSYRIDHKYVKEQLQLFSKKLSLTQKNNVKKIKLNNRLRGSIELSAQSNEMIIVEFSGTDVLIENLTVVTSLNPDQIIWHFPNAKTLTLSHSGVSLATGRHLGMPGTFIAPNAVFEFHNALITGAIYTQDLRGMANTLNCNDIVSGQVNPYGLKKELLD